jgi:hypothetical protein
MKNLKTDQVQGMLLAATAKFKSQRVHVHVLNMDFYPLFCTIMKTFLLLEGKNIENSVREWDDTANIYI